MLNDFLWLKIFKDGVVLLIFHSYLCKNLPHSLPRSFAGNTQQRQGWACNDGKFFENTCNSTKKTDRIGLINIRTRTSLFNGKVNIISSPGNRCELIASFN
jgi:hypothetical protein